MQLFVGANYVPGMNFRLLSCVFDTGVVIDTFTSIKEELVGSAFLSGLASLAAMSVLGDDIFDVYAAEHQLTKKLGWRSNA